MDRSKRQRRRRPPTANADAALTRTKDHTQRAAMEPSAPGALDPIAGVTRDSRLSDGWSHEVDVFSLYLELL